MWKGGSGGIFPPCIIGGRNGFDAGMDGRLGAGKGNEREERVRGEESVRDGAGVCLKAVEWFENGHHGRSMSMTTFVSGEIFAWLKSQ